MEKETFPMKSIPSLFPATNVSPFSGAAACVRTSHLKALSPLRDPPGGVCWCIFPGPAGTLV